MKQGLQGLNPMVICGKCHGTGRLTYSDGELMSCDLGECPACYGTGSHNPNYIDDEEDDLDYW